MVLKMELSGAFQNRIFLFLCACVSGILFALVWRKYEQTVELSSFRNHFTASLRKPDYQGWLQRKKLSIISLPTEVLRYSNEISDFDIESDFLFRSVRVLCLVFVNSHKGAEAVKDTWTKHCNIVTFFGRFVDDKIPVMKVPPLTSFEGFCYAFSHVYKKYKKKFDWILIADDSTYAVIENLRYYVASLNASLPYYLGHPVKDYTSLYNIGTAGIVLSKGSSLLIHSIYASGEDCKLKRPPSWYFDQSIGKILHSFNIHPLDTRDDYLRGRFNPFSVETMLIPGSISVFSSYWRTSVFPTDEGMNCCSDRAITFHGLLPPKLFLMEFLQYHLAVFRNSFKGLGNKLFEVKDVNTTVPPRKVGEPFVKLLNSNSNKGKKVKKTVIESIWKELFGN